jgi:hypothetical protein
MNYYDSAEDIVIDRKRALREVRDHNADWEEFIADHGNSETYDAQVVLGWLGY